MADGSVSSYTATVAPGSASCTAVAPTVTCTITNLTARTSYTATVTATNRQGTSPASRASNAVTPTAPANIFTMELLKNSAQFITTQLNLPRRGQRDSGGLVCLWVVVSEYLAGSQALLGASSVRLELPRFRGAGQLPISLCEGSLGVVMSHGLPYGSTWSGFSVVVLIRLICDQRSV